MKNPKKSKPLSPQQTSQGGKSTGFEELEEIIRLVLQLQEENQIFVKVEEGKVDFFQTNKTHQQHTWQKKYGPPTCLLVLSGPEETGLRAETKEHMEPKPPLKKIWSPKQQTGSNKSRLTFLSGVSCLWPWKQSLDHWILAPLLFRTQKVRILLKYSTTCAMYVVATHFLSYNLQQIYSRQLTRW